MAQNGGGDYDFISQYFCNYNKEISSVDGNILVISYNFRDILRA